MSAPISALLSTTVQQGPEGIARVSQSFQNNGTGGVSFNFKLPEEIDPAVPGSESATGASDSAVFGPTRWGQSIERMVMDVNQSQATASEKIRDVLAGGPTTVHEAMIAMQESGVRFQMLAEMRNKAVEAYQEVMRMQV